MLFSWCCRWFFPITSPAVQELDRKVTMAEQIATIRYRMNAFMFWFMIFFCPLLSFAFSSPQKKFSSSVFWRVLFAKRLVSRLGVLFSLLLFSEKPSRERIVVVVLFSCASPFSSSGLFYFPNYGDIFLQLGKWFCALSESRCKDTKSRFIRCAIACDTMR